MMIVRESTGSKQTNKQTPISHQSLPALVQMRCELGTDTKGTLKGCLCLTRKVTETFCSVKHHIEGMHGKEKKKTYFILRNAVKV